MLGVSVGCWASATSHHSGRVFFEKGGAVEGNSTKQMRKIVSLKRKIELKWHLEASLDGKMEFKSRLEGSFEAKMEFKWRLEASLKGQVDSK